MKYLRYAFLISLALVLIIVAVANKAPAELAFLPPDLANLIGMNWSITLPVFLVFFLGIVFGVLVGFIWEWLREYKLRSEAAANGKALRQAERELKKLKQEKYADQEDVATYEKFIEHTAKGKCPFLLCYRG